MSFPGTLILLLLSLAAAHRCLANEEAGAMMGETTAVKNDQTLTPHNAHQKMDNGTMKRSVTIAEFSSSLDEKVVVEEPTPFELSCELSAEASKGQSNVEVMWRHNDEDVNTTDFTVIKTEAKWQTWYKFSIKDISSLGNYTCIFKAQSETKATFHLNLPKIKGGDKPVVSYEGDTVVMKCDSAKHTPLTWVWYRADGDNKVALNDSLMPSKYEITRKLANETKLHIKELSANDSGLYFCEAVYPIGEREGKISLNVLSYLVPLKPFFVIVAEVIILVAIILIYEMQTKKKQANTGEDDNHTEQTEHLKADEVNGVENDTTRHRKV